MTPSVTPRATRLATPVDLRRHRNTSDDELAGRLHPEYGASIGRVPPGRSVYRGLPFQLAGARAHRRWLLVDRTVTIDMRAAGAVIYYKLN